MYTKYILDTYLLVGHLLTRMESSVHTRSRRQWGGEGGSSTGGEGVVRLQASLSLASRASTRSYKCIGEKKQIGSKNLCERIFELHKLSSIDHRPRTLGGLTISWNLLAVLCSIAANGYK